MRRLGDITKISGYDAPVVDVVIGGSPCQDLSIAGNRAGLAGARSGLFMEQIRIIREMREADARTGRTGQFIRPRFMVWENVPGAFRSNKRQDFKAVLEETIRIAEPDAPDIPLPEKWPLADAYYGDGWSVAYRVLDAQFWGVPQRRRRIALVADFGGQSAPEILFVRKSVCWDTPAGETAGEESAGGTGSGAGYAISFQERAGKAGGGKGILIQENRTGALSTLNNQYVCDARGNSGGKSEPLPFDTTQITSPQNQSRPKNGDPCHTLTAGAHPQAIVMATGQAGAEIMRDVSPTINCDHEQPIVVAHTLRAQAQDPHAADLATYPITGGIVRRLTPAECELLQGYPRGWTNIGPWADSTGKLHKESSDSARYKALGNSIALPPWKWVLKRLCAMYERDATMASLFDGIGGFPLIWERLNGPGSCLWASEIDEFCVAVTKRRFGGSFENRIDRC